MGLVALGQRRFFRRSGKERYGFGKQGNSSDVKHHSRVMICAGQEDTVAKWPSNLINGHSLIPVRAVTQSYPARHNKDHPNQPEGKLWTKPPREEKTHATPRRSRRFQKKSFRRPQRPRSNGRGSAEKPPRADD